MVVRIAPINTGDFTPLESDVYTGTIHSINTVERDPDMYHDTAYEQFVLLWEIEDEETTLKSWFSISVNEKSNLSKKLLPALGIAPIAPGAEWDEDDWIGMSCLLQVEKFAKADGRESNKIVNYMRLPKRGKTPRPERELAAVGANRGRDENEDTSF